MKKRLLLEAAKLAYSGSRKRKAFVAAVGIRSDGTIVRAPNGSSRMRTSKRHPESHAERRLVKKLDYGSTVYVVRVKKEDGSMALAKPCKNCENALRNRGVKRVYYSISENEWGTYVLKS